MAIANVIYQTFKSSKLPIINQWFIHKFRRENPDYKYEFFDDEQVDDFIFSNYGRDISSSYRRIQIGAAKADFFRYAILYKTGGVYVDVDSRIRKKLDEFILPDDVAVISLELNPGLYVQWALIYEQGHPFLERTLELILENISANKYPHDVHRMTGPSVYSDAIRQCLEKDPYIKYRLLGVDYNRNLQFKFPLSKLIYRKGEHWKDLQKIKTVLALKI